MSVTDTHPLLWFANGRHSYLSARVLSVFNDCLAGRQAIYVPTMVLFEIALLNAKGKIKLSEPFERWVAALSGSGNFVITDLDVQIIGLSVGYGFNDDPFDKVIVATAETLELPLITKDVDITGSNLVDIVW